MFFLLLISNCVTGQQFEGKLKWSATMEYKDQRKKDEIEKSQRKDLNPHQKAKLKEMDARMEDPEMKEMIEKNPQMKEQMLMASSGIMGGLPFPTSVVIKVKDENTITQISYGGIINEILYIKKKDQSYALDHLKKTYTKIATAAEGKIIQNKPPVVTKTSEATKILGYNCIKYVVNLTENGKRSSQEIWSTIEIEGLNSSQLGKYTMAKKTKWFLESIEGFPLRLIQKTHDGVFSMEATEIIEEPQRERDFVIPIDYKEAQPKVEK